MIQGSSSTRNCLEQSITFLGCVLLNFHIETIILGETQTNRWSDKGTNSAPSQQNDPVGARNNVKRVALIVPHTPVHILHIRH